MFETAVLLGGAFGARHAFEADHLAAVATLVDDDRPASTGAAWGVGHSVPIAIVGGLFVLLDIQLPDVVGTAFEAVVAVILVGLGLRVLAGREAVGPTIVQHIHADRWGERVHHHLPINDGRIGLTHSHTGEASFAVGIVHGLAGSGGVVVALAAATPTVTGGFGFLTGFAAASVVSMSLAAWGWSRGVAKTGRLRLVAGLVSVAAGLLLAAEIVGMTFPF